MKKNRIIFGITIIFPILFFVLLLSKPATAQEKNWKELSVVLEELIKSRDIDSAYTLTCDFLEHNPEHDSALATRMIYAVFTNQDPSLIAKDLEVYARVSDNDLTLAQGIIAIYIQQYKDKKAMKLVEAVIPRYPDADTLYQLRGQLKALAADYKGSIEDLNKALEINPDNELAISLLSNSCFLDKDVKKAFEYVDRLISLKSPLAEQAVSTITNGNDWEPEHLKQALALNDMPFIWEDSEESCLIFIDEETLEKRSRIEVIPFDSYEDAEERVKAEKDKLLEMGESEEDITVFSFGPFYFDQGCGDDKKCNESFAKLKDFLLNMKERRFKM